jgi:hypothetical protein
LKNKTPLGIHALTTIHGLGAIACIVMGIGCTVWESFRLSLIKSPGSALLMNLFGRNVWVFLLIVATLLSVLCYGSWRLRPWAQPLTVGCYSIGVGGGLWEAWMGLPAGFLAASINAVVVVYVCTRQARAAYGKI